MLCSPLPPDVLSNAGITSRNSLGFSDTYAAWFKIGPIDSDFYSL